MWTFPTSKPKESYYEYFMPNNLLKNTLDTIEGMNVSASEKSALRAAAVKAAVGPTGGVEAVVGGDVAIKTSSVAAEEKMLRDKTAHIGKESAPALSAEVLELLRTPSGTSCRWLGATIIKLIEESKANKKILGWFQAAGTTPAVLVGGGEEKTVLRLVVFALLEKVYFARAVAVTAKTRPTQFKTLQSYDQAFAEMLRPGVQVNERHEGDLYAEHLLRINKGKHQDLFIGKDASQGKDLSGNGHSTGPLKRPREGEGHNGSFDKSRMGKFKSSYSFEDCIRLGLCAHCYERGHLGKNCPKKKL